MNFVLTLKLANQEHEGHIFTLKNTKLISSNQKRERQPWFRHCWMDVVKKTSPENRWRKTALLKNGSDKVRFSAQTFFFNGEKFILNKTFGLFSRFSLSYLSERKNLFRYLWNKYNTGNKQCCVGFLSTRWYVSENPLICFVILLNSWIIIHVHCHAVISIALTSENFRKKYYCQLWWLP